MINTWYVLGIEDSMSKFGYSQITTKGVYYKTLKDANKFRKLMKNRYTNKVVILKRTCEPLV